MIKTPSQNSPDIVSEKYMTQNNAGGCVTTVIKAAGGEQTSLLIHKCFVMSEEKEENKGLEKWIVGC